MIRRLLLVGLSCLARPLAALAQTVAPGGLLAEYYTGQFERRLLVRRDATINFDWAHRSPAPGVPPEYFSVRWTGTLTPPATGRYVFHLTVDDGMRVWLDDKLVFDEWRDQPVRSFAVSVPLVAGRPYRLKVEYYNAILDTRARLTWERPDRPVPELPALRNGYGLFGKAVVREEPIAAAFLTGPRPLRVLPPAAARAATPPALLAAGRSLPAALPPRRAAPAATGRPVPARTARSTALAPPPVRVAPTAAAPAAPVAAPPRPPALAVVADTAAARVASVADGQAVTLPELLFAQGSALLPPAACPALDALAAALRLRPALRLAVEGHTDNVGNPELNRQLSQQRAETVCRYLTAHGVPAAQLRPVGYGGTRPVANNANAAQRPRNRRVMLVRE